MWENSFYYKFPKWNRYQRFIQIDLSNPNYNNTVNPDAFNLSEFCTYPKSFDIIVSLIGSKELVWLRVYCSFYGCYISFKRFSTKISDKNRLRYENSPLYLTFTLHCPKTFATFCLNTRVINRARDFWGLFKTVYGPDLPRTSICKCTF